MDNLPKSIFTLEFSNKKQLFYFYDHISLASFWEKPDHLILIDKTDQASIIAIYDLLKTIGTRPEQIEFNRVLQRHSLKLPPEYLGHTEPEFINDEGRVPLCNWVRKKAKELEQRKNQQLSKTASRTTGNASVSPADLKVGLERTLSINESRNKNKVTDRPGPKSSKRDQSLNSYNQSQVTERPGPKFSKTDRSLDLNNQSQGEFGLNRPSAKSIKGQFEAPVRSRSLESNHQSPDVSQPLAHLFKRPAKRFSSSSLLSQDSPTGSNEHIEEKSSSTDEKQLKHRSTESSPRGRLSCSSSSSSVETAVDGWRKRGSGGGNAGNNVTHNKGARPTGGGVNVPPGGSGPPYIIYMGGTPYNTVNQDIEEFFNGISLVKITLFKGYAEVEVNSWEDALEAMKRDMCYIRNRYIILRIVDPASRPSMSVNKDVVTHTNNSHSRERVNKRSRSPLPDVSASKRVKTFEETFRPRTEPVITKRPSLNRPNEKSTIHMSLHTSTPVNNIPKGFDLRNKLIERKNMPATVTSGALEEMDWDRPPQDTQTGESIVVNNKQTNPTNYDKIYLVCDTCALLNEPSFMEKLCCKGNYLGVPLKVIIPYIVLEELENMSKKSEEQEKAVLARQLNRLIRELTKDDTNPYIKLQEGHLRFEPSRGVKLVINDDSVLNCALQTRERCGEKETIVMITADINLLIKSSAFKISSHDWMSFKKWIRELKYNLKESKEINNLNHEDNQMDVDDYSEEDDDQMEELNMSSSPIQQHFNTSVESPVPYVTETRKSTPEPLRKASKLQNLIKTTVKEMSIEFQELLRQVLNAAVEKEYQHLKQHATSADQASWTLVQFVKEIQRRWSLIRNGQNLKDAQRDIFTNILKFATRSNTERSDWVPEDVDEFVSLLTKVAREFARDYKPMVDGFVNNIHVMQEEFREGQLSVDSETSPIEIISPSDISSSEVDTALQTILVYSRTAMEKYLSLQRMGVPYVERLQKFLHNLDALHNALQFVCELRRVTSASEDTSGLIWALKYFQNELGEPYNFDIGPESVVELISNPKYRDYLQPMIRTLYLLRNNACKVLRKSIGPTLKGSQENRKAKISPLTYFRPRSIFTE